MSFLLSEAKISQLGVMNIFLMETLTLKNVNNCLNTNIYSYLETTGGQSYTPYLNVVHLFNTRVNKTFVAP